jgi:translocon-associated protein subunit alpha
VLFLILPLAAIVQRNDALVYADERGDIVDGEDEGPVEGEDDVPADDGAMTGNGNEQDEALPTLRANPDADTHFLFIKPAGSGLELPAGKDVNFLVSFANKGKKDFTVDSMEASFRYAMDFSYHLQNFSAIGYNRLVRPNEEATLAYSFFVSEAYSARPYGFTVNLYYRDAEGNQFANAVFNETVSIVELDEGLDGETFFLYVLLGGVGILILVAAQQFLSTLSKKHGPSKAKVEMGTASQSDIDYSWLPQETLHSLNKSPKASKQSPRQRRPKRATGSADD